jgi:hypothetical protein
MKQFIICLIIIIACSLPINLSGQHNQDVTSEVLEKLFGRLVNNYDDAARIRINDSIRTIVDSYVRSDTIFSHRFNNLKYLGQITSPDTLMKIVTWNLVLGSSPGKYYCYFIRKVGKEQKNKVYSLTTDYKESQIVSDTTYSESNWYGALYYDLRQISLAGTSSWILLGIDYGNPLTSRKIIEVLSFRSDSSLLFGRKWFEAGDQLIFRKVFEYASNGMMSLRFTSDKSIVFDHLVPFIQLQNEGRMSYGSDFSYDAYNFENGIWRLSLNVDARNKQ